MLFDAKHPHARGEDFHPQGGPALMKETPPRTWGRPNKTLCLKDTHRNTPTHVGKTLNRSYLYG